VESYQAAMRERRAAQGNALAYRESRRAFAVRQEPYPGEQPSAAALQRQDEPVLADAYLIRAHLVSDLDAI